MNGPIEAPTSARPDATPRGRCLRCWRPSACCLCAHLDPLETRTRVVILQHRRESTVPVNTARLAEVALARCELHVGVDFESSPRVRARMREPGSPAILLFPGAGARSLEREPPASPVTLFVVDGTWSQAKKVLKKNPSLESLPRFALDPREPSRYRIRREPAASCLSTIEAIASALAVLEGDPERFEALLKPLDVMVAQQLAYAETVHSKRQLTRRRRAGPPPLLTLLERRAPDLVIAYGEANAWPRGTPDMATPELVHYAAERVATGERFEAMLAPRRPLSPSFTHHTGIAPEVVRAGESVETFRRRWADFVRPTDLVCVWGHFAAALAASEGAAVPETLDIRSGVRRMLHRTPGDVAECAELFAAARREPWVMGRTGARLAALRAVVGALLERAAR